MRSRLPSALLATLWLLAGEAPARADERLLYVWKLDGWLGSVAALFVPSKGDGVLTTESLPGGRMRSELVITSTSTRAGEYFRYGAEWDPASGQTTSAWSDLVWRGDKKSKQAEVEEADVVDIVSAISSLRRDPPRAPQRLEIWSDGRLYPVLVIPHGREPRSLEGRAVQARHFKVLGVAEPDRKLWKGELEIWIADDPLATPVEIVVARQGARVRLELVDTDGAVSERRAERAEGAETPRAGRGDPP